MKNNGTFVYLVQEETGGIPYEPEVYTDQGTAERHYVRLVNQQHHTSFSSFGESNDYMNSDDCCWDKWGVRLFQCPILSDDRSRNKLGDLCFADTLKVWSEGNKIVLFAEVDGLHFDSREYRTKKQWLQSIVRRVYDCSLGRLN